MNSLAASGELDTDGELLEVATLPTCTNFLLQGTEGIDGCLDFLEYHVVNYKCTLRWVSTLE